MNIECTVSGTEISRRKRAFLSLIISLTVGLILGSVRFIAENPVISSAGIMVIVILLTLTVYFLSKTFDNYLKMKVYLTDLHIIRDTVKKREEYRLEDIIKFNIKWTTRKTLREIGITLKDGKTVFFNGLDGFERFRDGLLERVKGCAVREYAEPADFDHPLFYVILGLFIGYATALSISSVISMDRDIIGMISLATALFVAGLGIYIILKKPVYGRFGGKNPLADYLSGAFFVAAGIYILVMQLLRG